MLVVALLGLSFIAGPNLFASAEDEVDSALATAQKWMSQIDAGQYDDSYAFGCEAMHEKVPQDTWENVLKALRTPWGSPVSRKEVSHVYKPNGYEGTEGEFMVITYDTAFQKLNPATEEVVLKWEDGKWRGAGYNARAKVAQDDTVTAPQDSNTTEIHTDDHVRPQPPSP